MESGPDFENWGSRKYNIDERQAFWTKMRPWFSSKGYELYNYDSSSDHEESFYLEMPSTLYMGAPELPYALLGRRPEYRRMLQKFVGESEVLSAFAVDFGERFHHAQDSHGRDVIVKPVKRDTDEMKILQRLKANLPLSSEKADFTGIIPVLDILPYEENFFIVMPRWGDVPFFSSWNLWYKHNYEILDHIHCLLKGLAILHNNRIFHRDLHEGNMLVNVAWSRCSGLDDNFHAELREQQKLVYAINDFNVSIIFLLETSLVECRLNFNKSNAGIRVWDRPYGVRACKLDFNPFPHDVACLGMYFCQYFQYLTGDLPFLAPLLDGMVTADIDKRLTAREVLNFFELEHASLTGDQLEGAPVQPPRPLHGISWDRYDRWESLTPGLKCKWASYRMRKPSWWMGQLESLCLTRRGAYTVHYSRQLGRYLTASLIWILNLPTLFYQMYLS